MDLFLKRVEIAYWCASSASFFPPRLFYPAQRNMEDRYQRVEEHGDALHTQAHP
jgi:hypothetical protein